jgi:hypothetical protein
VPTLCGYCKCYDWGSLYLRGPLGEDIRVPSSLIKLREMQALWAVLVLKPNCSPGLTSHSAGPFLPRWRFCLRTEDWQVGELRRNVIYCMW